MEREEEKRDDDETCVAFEGLNDFLGLKTPEIDEIVFRSADDPFAVCDGKSGKDTIRPVFVASIRFETLSGRVVPQMQSVVHTPRQDELSVGRKLDKRPFGCISM